MAREVIREPEPERLERPTVGRLRREILLDALARAIDQMMDNPSEGLVRAAIQEALGSINPRELKALFGMEAGELADYIVRHYWDDLMKLVEKLKQRMKEVAKATASRIAVAEAKKYESEEDDDEIKRLRKKVLAETFAAAISELTQHPGDLDYAYEGFEEVLWALLDEYGTYFEDLFPGEDDPGAILEEALPKLEKAARRIHVEVVKQALPKMVSIANRILQDLRK